jgi:hypothetical protein
MSKPDMADLVTIAALGLDTSGMELDAAFIASNDKWARIEDAAGVSFNEAQRALIDRGLRLASDYGEGHSPFANTPSKFAQARKRIDALRAAVDTPLGRAMFPDGVARLDELARYYERVAPYVRPRVFSRIDRAFFGNHPDTRGLLPAAIAFREAWLEAGGKPPAYWRKGTEAGGGLLLGLHEALRQAIAYKHDSPTLAAWLIRNLPPE